MLCVVVCLLHVIGARGDAHRSHEVPGPLWRGGECGEAVKREVHLGAGAAELEVADGALKVVRQRAGREHVQEGVPGVCSGDHRVRVNLFARLQHHANRALTLQQDLLDGGVGADVRAVEARRVCDRGRNGARPTLRERPLAEGAVDLTEVVMEEDHPRPWRLDPKEGADDP